MKKLKIVIAASLLIFILACRKENKNSNTDIITNGNWAIAAITIDPPFDIDGDGIVDSDLFQQYDACEKDDYYTFKKNNKMDINAGGLKCYPSDPQVYSVDWQFTDNEKGIMIDGDNATIVELTSEHLQFSYDEYGYKMTVKMVKH
jgi:hypothetical protein